MKTSTVLGVLLVVLIILGGWWYLASQKPLAGGPAPATDTSASAGHTTSGSVVETQTQTQVQASANTAPASATVTYTDGGFSPSRITIVQSGTVTFVNQSGGQMWVASSPHPAHTGYSNTTRSQHCPDTAGAAFDECTAVGAGQSYSFTFQKAGTWGYHNHVNAGDFGTVVVQ